MTIRNEIGIISIVAGIAVGVLTQVPSPFNLVEAEATDRFSAEDFNAFDRNFELAGTVCAVGIARDGLCFEKSPIESQLHVGAELPHYLPNMPADMSVILRTNLKSDSLQTQRFGQSLILVDTRSRQIVDRLTLSDTLYTDQHVVSGETGI